MLSLVRLERKQTNSSNPFRIRIFLFLSYSSGIETINSRAPAPIPDQNGQSVYPFSDQNGAKPFPMGRHIVSYLIYSSYKGVHPPPEQNNGKEMYKKVCFTCKVAFLLIRLFFAVLQCCLRRLALHDFIFCLNEL